MSKPKTKFAAQSELACLAESSTTEFRNKLRQLVETESPSNDKAAVDHANNMVASWFKSIGGRVRIHKQHAHGDVLQIDFAGATRGKPLLLLGHLDTVWDIGTLSRMTWREEKGKIFGPGIFDMKFGVVQILFAIRALQQQHGVLPRPVTVLLNPDEEIGSPVSRPITEKLAKKSAAVLVFEPAAGARGACKTARKGVGDYLLRVRGVASHAGLDFEKGASAIVELAHQLARIAEFGDVASGLTINPGIIGGGTRTNVVAEFAEAHIDVRVATSAQVRVIERKFRSLRPIDKRCKLEISGGINRMPFERNKETLKLYRLAQALAFELGFDLPEVSVGGGSDGNFTAAIDIPTLDGLGAVGDGAHAAHEHVLASEIPRRVALAARLIESL